MEVCYKMRHDIKTSRARTSTEVKVGIEAAWLACPNFENETHLIPFPLLVIAARLDAANLCVICRVPIRAEVLCDGEKNKQTNKQTNKQVHSL